MKEQIIQFETAKLAKEKEFDIECLHFYTKPNSKMFGLDKRGRPYSIKNMPKELYTVGNHAALNAKSVYLAPTQSLLQKWTSEVHNIDISISPSLVKWYYYTIYLNKICMDDNEQPFKTYELALEEALQEALKLIKDEPTGN